MRGKLTLLCLALASTSVAGHDELSGMKTQWLGWPVIGYPFNVPGGAALIPPPSERFLSGVRRDVIIGLRSDGTVVWKHVPVGEPKSKPSSSTLEMLLVPNKEPFLFPPIEDTPSE